MKQRLPLVGQPNQRNLDSLQALIEGKDQRYVGGIVVPIPNPITGKTTYYFEKRPGFEAAPFVDCLGIVQQGCAGTAIYYSRTTGKTISVFCDDQVYADCDSAGEVIEETVNSTFWNSLDQFGSVLTNGNYTVTISQTGEGGLRPHGGIENTTLFGSGLHYWEIEIVNCPVDGDYPTLSFMLLDRFDGPGFGTVTAGESPNYVNRNLRISDQVSLTALYPDGWAWHSNLPTMGPSRTIIEAFGGNPTTQVTVNTTGVSGFTTGDRLMFAFNRTTGKLWLGKNGTWFNSGDPAAGTNAQVESLVQHSYSGGLNPNWRFLYATNHYPYDTNPVVFNSSFGNSVFPQEYDAPSGFSGLLAPSSADFDTTGWAYRASATRLSSVSDDLSQWTVAGTLDTDEGETTANSTAKLQQGGLYYFEIVIGVEANTAVGIRLMTDPHSAAPTSGTAALWSAGGTLLVGDGGSPVTTHTTGVTTYAISDVLMFAVNLSSGRMWVGKNGTWTNSGDPAAGTNYQFSTIPTDERFVIHTFIQASSVSTQIVLPANFTYSAPSGFRAGVPLTIAAQ